MSLGPQPHPLPEELARALRRATDTSLSALGALRVAVRTHVRGERAGGSDLDSIQLDLRDIIAQVRLTLPPSSSDSAAQDVLAAAIIGWTPGFFTER